MSKPLTAPAMPAFDRPDPIPAGLALGRCYSVVDLGMQKVNWQGQEKIQHKVQIAFELPVYRMEFERDGETKEGPRVIGARLTLSMHAKATLRRYIEEWFGKKFPSDLAAASFDIRKLIGRVAMINIVHSDPQPDGTVYNNIASLAPPMAGMNIPPAELDPIIYTGDEPEVFEKLPKFLQNQILNQLVPEQSPPLPDLKTEQGQVTQEQIDNAFVDAAKEGAAGTDTNDPDDPLGFSDSIPFS